jgi:hypothetical protein
MVVVAGVGEQGQEEELARGCAAEEPARSGLAEGGYTLCGSLEHLVSGTDVDVVRRYLVDHAQRCVLS